MNLDEAHKLADALYDAGYNAKRKGKDYDPRGTDEWQAVVDNLLKQNQPGEVK